MQPGRRHVLRMAGGVLAAAWGGSVLGGTSGAGAEGEPSSGVSPPPLDGELRFDDATLGAAADDFGHLVHRRPQAVLLPASARDVSTVVGWAGAHGLQVAAQGRRHSVYGRGQVHEGVAVDMSTLRAVGDVDGDRIVVDAGATWSDVLAKTIPLGLTPPVLTEYLDLSVGGTLVVGGVGAATSRHGVQADNVVELEVVTGDGRLVTCSRHEHADLFDAVRAGLAQVALITRATLPLVPAPEQVRRFLLFYRDLPSMIADARLLDGDGRFDTVQGGVLPTPDGWRYRLDAVAGFVGDDPPDDGALLAGLSDERDAAEIATLPYLGYLQRFAVLEELLRANGQWFHPHPWVLTFVGDSQVESVVGDVLASIDPADLGTYGQVVLSAFPRTAVRAPLLRLPDDDRCYAFNLIRVPTTDDADEAARLVESNRAVHERVLAGGGTLYPVSAFPMSPDDWRRHFGPRWRRLRAAKRAFDPNRVLTPGYELFAHDS